MLKLKAIFVLGMIICILGAAAIAGEQGEMAEMPPMGPTEEIKSLSYLIGTWDVEQKWRMGPEDDWMTSKGVAVYSDMYNGCALRHTFESEMMGMPYHGTGLLAYNRETGKWQSSWFDNMSAAISLYEGGMEGEKMVVYGEDAWQGQTYKARITTFNMTPESFDWTYEMSWDGGKSWFESGRSHYTKRQ